MELEGRQESLLPAYLASFSDLIGDARTGVTFGEIVKGIIGAGSLVCQRIAASSVILSESKDGARRVRRMVKGKSTKRSEIDAATELTMVACRLKSLLLFTPHPLDELCPDVSFFDLTRERFWYMMLPDTSFIRNRSPRRPTDPHSSRRRISAH
jgi:hypothetical protein